LLREHLIRELLPALQMTATGAARSAANGGA
jgi:hypothetical protein